MDILKLSKFSTLIFVFLITSSSCEDRAKVIAKDQKMCDCKDTIPFGCEIYLYKSLRKNKAGMKIFQIRKGKILSDISYTFSEKKNISIVIPKYKYTNALLRGDTIKIFFENGKKYTLYDFSVYPDYKGRKFVWCTLDYCKANYNGRTDQYE